MEEKHWAQNGSSWLNKMLMTTLINWKQDYLDMAMCKSSKCPLYGNFFSNGETNFHKYLISFWDTI
jgi:hypothetical protein